MKYILVLATAGLLLLNGVITVYADTPLYLPHISGGNFSGPVGASDETQISEAAILFCEDEGESFTVTRETDKIVDVICLPDSEANIEPEPTSSHKKITVSGGTSLVCTDPNQSVNIIRRGRKSIEVSCVPAATSTPTATAQPSATATQAPATNTPQPAASATPSATPTTVTAPGVAQPFGQSGEWKLIFSDEFDGSSLNTNTWEPSWFGGSGISKPVNTLEDGCYRASQVSVSGGTLNLQAGTTNDSNCKKRDNSQTPYMSGLVNTRKSFTFAYGYMEARLYLPGSNGNIWNWPAFWSDGTGTWPQTGEIDVVEGLSSHEACWHYHYEDNSGKHQGPGDCSEMDATGWHTYAAHWEPGKITFYYDGVKIGQQTEGVISANHFLILNYGIRDDYGINVPAMMQVDYVRVWKK